MTLQPFSSSNPARLVVLISGNGSNLQAVINTCEAGDLPARVSAVISNRREAYGLERARLAAIPALYFPKVKEMDRMEYDRLLAEEAAQYRPDWVLLLGWMRLLSQPFLNCFAGRVVNIHPALPGAFPGVNAIERAFEAYRNHEINHTGVMVHLVPNEGVDDGPLIDQEIVPIHCDDTLETLGNRVHQTEHRLLISVLKSLVTSNI